MSMEDRNTILETVDILKALGGNNGFSNLQPKFKKVLIGYANKLNKIVERDMELEKNMATEEFEGETVYES